MRRKKTKPNEVSAESLTYRKIRKVMAIKKTLSNISLSTIDHNSTPWQALQCTKYDLVEPVRSFKLLIGWFWRSNLAPTGPVTSLDMLEGMWHATIIRNDS